MKRKCKDCGETKDLEAFAKAGVVKGIQYYRHLCVPCYYEYKQPRKRELKAWFVGFKKTQKCKECGNDDWRVLDFDHLGDKTFNISDGMRWGYSKEKILNEVVKCQVLCANCHRIKTFEEGNFHGH